MPRPNRPSCGIAHFVRLKLKRKCLCIPSQTLRPQPVPPLTRYRTLHQNRSISIILTGFFLCIFTSFVDLNAQTVKKKYAPNRGKRTALPLVDDKLIFVEQDGWLAVEAEHFFRQSADQKRRFYLTTARQAPDISPDGDATHVGGASGGAYLEILPDTRRTHDDTLTTGENFAPQPGKQAILEYKIKVTTPGRYYVWVRAYSTGTEDNGLHVGLNGHWPESGQRLQWCAGKHSWWWESKQRTQKEHCGIEDAIFLDIDKAGEHTIQFSMREDGFEFDKWLMTKDRDFIRPEGLGPSTKLDSEHHALYQSALPPAFDFVKPRHRRPPISVATEEQQSSQRQDRIAKPSPTKPVSDSALQQPRGSDGNQSIEISGELMEWHKVTLSVNGPYAHEQDNIPNPFTDYGFWVTFSHADGTSYRVPGYFAADGNAANSSAESGTIWRAHFAPDRPGRWSYAIEMTEGKNVALASDYKKRLLSFTKGELKQNDQEASTPESGIAVVGIHGRSGSFKILATEKTGRDFRHHGRLDFVGIRYLKFAGSGKHFLKIGADAPETLLGYADFDGATARKKNVPLKTFTSHVIDWKPGDPTWGAGKGKGLIGAVNYLSGKGCNAFSFLTYNAGGDGDNVWPFIARDDKMHFDCSKLDQWANVFDHATNRGMYLHFKLQETENDDHVSNDKTLNRFTPTSLDGGELNNQRKLYLREIVSRFGHELAINWNLGEENTQSTRQQADMIGYIRSIDAYQHPVVLHTYPQQQDPVYRPLLGDKTLLSGLSLQNSSINDTHWQALKWINLSETSGHPWVIAFDESGSAAHGSCPDLGYLGFDGKDTDGRYIYTEHEVRGRTLWGTLLAGGAGCEYYFGYKFAQNDLNCEDWRSRDRSWDYGRIAINFFHDHKIPFWEMKNANAKIGNAKNDNLRYLYAKTGKAYIAYLAKGQVGGDWKLDLRDVPGVFTVDWFDPRNGGGLQTGNITTVEGGQQVSLGDSPGNPEEDWVVLVRAK